MKNNFKFQTGIFWDENIFPRVSAAHIPSDCADESEKLDVR